MEFAFVLCAVLIVQYFLSYMQIRYYQKNMDKMVTKYRGKEGYFLFSSMERKKLRAGAIAILIVDKNFEVKECYVLNGYSILSSFKEMKEYKELHVASLLDDMHEKTIDKKKDKKRWTLHRAIGKAAESALLSLAKVQVKETI